MTDDDLRDRRRFTRIDFDADVNLSQNDLTFKTHIVDLSINGILLETPENYELSAELPAEISIVLADNTQICMSVSMVHSSNHTLGFHCESIDLDSIQHLRRLIELNINVPNAAERVLHELVSQQSLSS